MSKNKTNEIEKALKLRLDIKNLLNGVLPPVFRENVEKWIAEQWLDYKNISKMRNYIFRGEELLLKYNKDYNLRKQPTRTKGLSNRI